MPQVPGTVESNPYLRSVDDGKRHDDMVKASEQIPTVTGGDNPYLTQIQTDKQRKDTALTAALQPALKTDPDKYAGTLKLSRESGLPPGAVEMDPASVEQEQRLRRVVEGVSRSPLLQAWYTQDDNAVIGMDDYENLTGLESAMRTTGDIALSPFRGFDVSVGQGIQGLGRLNDAAARAITAGTRAIGLDPVADVLETPIPWWANPSQWARSAGEVVEKTGGPPLPEGRQNFATDVGEGIGSLIGQIVASRVNPTAGVTLMAGQGAEQAGRRAEEKGATQEQTDKAVALGAAITAATEKLGLDLLLERLPPKIQNRAAQWLVDKAIAGGIEGTEEAVEQLANNLTAQMLYDPNAPIFEGVADNASVGAAVGVIARTLLGVRVRGQEAQKSKAERTSLDGMVAAAAGSKLAQRDPTRFEQLVHQMAQEGATNVYIPAESAQKLFQSMPPIEAAQALGLPVENYLEAVITGGDLAIPVEVYLSRVAPQFHEQLRDVARFTPGAMTPAESEAMEEEARGAADRFMASVQSTQPGDERVYDDVTGMLLGTGRYRREDVEKYAQILQAGFRTLAAREGMDAFDLYSQYRLRIKSELPAALQKIDVDTVIDPLIERLRTGDVPKDNRVSLADFLAEGGGVTDAKLTGEIATLNENDRAVRRGKKRLVRADAERDLDRAREAAAEAGYLPADSDVNDLLALLDQEMSGSPVYAQGEETTPELQTRQAVEDLEQELGRHGIDVHKATNAEIKAALFGENGTEVPDELVRVFDQPAGPARDVEVTARTKAGEFRLRDTEAPAGTDFSEFGQVRQVRAFDGDRKIGKLVYANDGTPPTIEVDEAYRRKGVGTAMLKLARQQGGVLGDAQSGIRGRAGEYRTEAGQAFRSQADEGAVTLFQSAADQTETEAFKRWFGDSKVVDENGDPLVVYHGTADEFDTFDLDLAGSTDEGDYGSGFYFSDKRSVAERYPRGGAARVISAYIRVENPLILRDMSQLDALAGPERTWSELFANERSQALRNAGHDGLFVESDGEWFVLSPEQIKSATANRGTFDPNDPSILNQADGTPNTENAIRRGYIKFGGDRQFTIGLLEKADATTFLHETGHFFLEVLGDLAADPNASPDIVRDYDALLNWFGVESREQIGTDQHEQFARGFEQYLGEGKAPSAELAPAFARFKAWVKAIYRSLRNLNVDLTDDVRGVFDRLLATDEEISQAEAGMDYAPLFADARAAGWTDAEFATRLQLQEQAREESEARLMARAMKDVTREARAWWKERAEEVRAEVTADVQARPVYRAWAMLANGATPDGTPIDGAGEKLSKDWLLAQYGQEWLNKNLLRKRVYQATGGADPDVVATGVGFESGDAMVRAIANAQPQAAVIAAETHARMVDEYGDVMTDGSLPEAAMRAVHGDRRFKAMEADLKALERLAGEPKPTGRNLRAVAEAIVGQKRVRDLQPNSYLRAERKAAKEAIKAAGQQKWGEALEAQRRRLLNAHLFDVASKAKDETERLQRYIKKFEKPALRQRLGKIGRLDEVDALLSQYDLRTISGKKADQDKARAELLGRIEAGEVIAPVSFTRSLQAGIRTNWRELTVEELRGLRDILSQTEAAARAEYEAYLQGERVKIDDKADAIAESTVAGGKAVMPVYGDLSPDETVKRAGKQALASWLRPSALARLLDGGKDDGAWTKNVIQPIRRAVTETLEPMKRKAQEDLSALYRKHYTTKEMAQMNQRQIVPGVNQALSRWDLISLALNWGNVENRKAVLDSEVTGQRPFTEAGVQTALQTLDARDWAFVQEAWDYIDSYWPAIKETQKRRIGIAPPKVEANAFTVTTRDGQQVELKGGYYPLKYNSRLDAKARQHEMDQAFERMRAGTLSSAQSKYGHTQERVGSGKQPVMLSMTVLHSHINNVIMDLALGDAVNYVDRVLTRSQVRQALISTGNLDALETWKLWLKDTATGEIGARTGTEQVAQFVRLGFTKSKVGFNAMTVVLQLTGLAQTIPVVGSKHVGQAALDMAGRPRAAIRQVMDDSAFMRTRYELNTFNKDIAAVQDALRSGAPVGKGSGFIGGFINAVRAVQLPPQMVNWAFFGIRQTQILVDTTTWLAGYRKAAGMGKSHAEAVLYADGIVENAQTSGMFSDRAAIERGTFSETTRQSEFVKLWTTLGSYMLAKGNIAFESYRRTDFRSPSSILGFGSDVLLLFAAEALLMAAIKGGWPDDDESWWWWTTKTVVTQATGTIPLIREVPGMAYGGGNTPIGATAGDIYRAYQQTSQGEVDEGLIKAYTNLIGTATGLPSAQINRATDAFWRETVEGQDVPAYEYVTGQRK
jgi:GNAT superfamily N-acetyltransferase